MSVLLDVGTKLEELGFGSLSSDPPSIHTDLLDELPNNCVAVLGFGGLAPTRTMAGAVAFEYPNVQIQVRNVAPETAESTCYSIYQQLPPAMKGAVINAHTYNYCSISGFPDKLKVDKNERTVYYCEFQIWRYPE